MELESVSFELAKKLKGVGFDGSCCVRWKDGKIDREEDYFFYSSNEDVYPNPTLELASKWFREKHNVIVSILPSRVGYKEKMEWYKSVAIYKKGLDPKYASYRSKFHGDYDDALEEGLKEACDLIKTIE